MKKTQFKKYHPAAKSKFNTAAGKAGTKTTSPDFMKIVGIVMLAALMFVNVPVRACTTFSFADKKGTIVFGRNFDFPVGAGHIEVNKRNMRKVAFVNPPEKSVEWISKYGSITFNQIGREFPYGGMNEVGLVIEQMWLQETQYPKPDQRAALTDLQWIQYQLDNSRSVDDVVASDTLIRISVFSISKLHFLVADAAGNVASIEFLNGRMIIHRDESMPYPVLTNCTYDHSLDYKMSKDQKLNKQFNAWTENSSGRFAKAASLIERYDGAQKIIDYSYAILDSVAQPNSTQWSVVYDITNRTIRYKTMENPLIRILKLADFDFSCNSPDLFVNISDTVCSVDDFHQYSFEANYELQHSVVSKVGFLKNAISPEAIKATAEYPGAVFCNDSK